MRRSQKEYLERTIADQRERIARQTAALKQLSDVADSIIACVAVKFGEKTDEGYTVELETKNITNALAKYEVTADKQEEKVVITVKPREAQ